MNRLKKLSSDNEYMNAVITYLNNALNSLSYVIDYNEDDSLDISKLEEIYNDINNIVVELEKE